MTCCQRALVLLDPQADLEVLPELGSTCTKLSFLPGFEQVFRPLGLDRPGDRQVEPLGELLGDVLSRSDDEVEMLGRIGLRISAKWMEQSASPCLRRWLGPGCC